MKGFWKKWFKKPEKKDCSIIYNDGHEVKMTQKEFDRKLAEYAADERTVNPDDPILTELKLIPFNGDAGIEEAFAKSFTDDVQNFCDYLKKFDSREPADKFENYMAKVCNLLNGSLPDIEDAYIITISQTIARSTKLNTNTVEQAFIQMIVKNE